jgi:acyl dehydratase
VTDEAKGGAGPNAGRWDELAARVGEHLGTSEPQLLTQAMVDQHAETTGDAQWIHNDPERARREGPFGGPIVQGFLLLSLFTAHAGSIGLGALGPITMGVNYGFDRVRFHAPVPVGAAVRTQVSLGEVRPKPGGSAVVGIDVVVEALADDGTATPAATARWLFLAVP